MRNGFPKSDTSQGLVLDPRVPYEARTALRRAESLAIAMDYEGAQSYYRLALEEARKGGEDFINWEPATEGLVYIDRAILIQNSIGKATKLMKEDLWQEAIEEYLIVLDLDSTNIKVAKNLKVLQDSDDFSKRYQLASKNLGNDNIQNIRVLDVFLKEVIELRQGFYESKLLENYFLSILSEQEKSRRKVIEKIRDLISQSKLSINIATKRAFISRANEIIDAARSLSLLLNDEEIAELRQLAKQEAKNITDSINANPQKEEYLFYQNQLEELQLENPLDKEVLFRLEWIRSKRRRLVRENSRNEKFNIQIKDRYLEAKIWFWMSIATALVLLTISIYIILSTFDKEDLVSSLISLISILPVLASRLVYSQSKATREGAENMRKELENETLKDKELEHSEFDALQKQIFGSSIESESK